MRYPSNTMIKTLILASVLGLSACNSKTVTAHSDEAIEAPAVEMTAADLKELILQFDEGATVNENNVVFKLTEREVMFVYDEEADRMRIMTPILQASFLNEEVQTRMLQANFDSVLDARYAIANGIVWATFIHPLSSLTEKEFLSGISQSVTAAETFGSTYTSGAVTFGGGDSNSIHQELLKKLEKARKELTDRDI